MRLSELEPRWLSEHVFIFKCPHCRGIWLSCKNVAMSSQEQFDLFEATLGPDWNMIIVPMKESYAWQFSGKDFETLTVTASVDASNSGHWHGSITNGECR